MKNKIMLLIGGLLAVMMVFGAVAVTNAYAQTSTPNAPTGQQGIPPPDGGRGFLGQTELEAAAKVLGMTADELSSAMQSGKTLEDLATSAGVDIQDVQDAISAARVEDMRTQIAQAVTDGTMTQDKADWLLEGLDKGYIDGHGFGLGIGGPDGKRGDMPLTDDVIAAAAKVLGMTSDEVSSALSSGKTLQDLATSAGVDFKDVMDAVHSVMPAPQGGPMGVPGQNGQPPAQPTQSTN